MRDQRTTHAGRLAARRGEAPWIAYKHLDSEPSIKGEDKRPQAITDAQLTEIAQTKMVDLNANDIEAAKRQVAGTARSMGITVSG